MLSYDHIVSTEDICIRLRAAALRLDSQADIMRAVAYADRTDSERAQALRDADCVASQTVDRAIAPVRAPEMPGIWDLLNVARTASHRGAVLYRAADSLAGEQRRDVRRFASADRTAAEQALRAAAKACTDAARAIYARGC